MRSINAMRPPVSVIVPTYNRASTLSRALTSVLAQTGDHDEVIVVDDGSEDNTQSVVRRFGDRVRYLGLAHSGPGAARNAGVADSRHELITFLDSDDEWLPGKLDVQCALMVARPDIVMSFADMTMLLPDGRMVASAIGRWQAGARPWEQVMAGPVPLSEIADWPGGAGDVPVYFGNLYEDLLRRCWIHCNAAMFRRSLAGDALHYSEDINIYEDWACFAETAKRGPFAFLQCCVATQICDSHSRLTHCDDLARATARVALLERTWGADAQFLEYGGHGYLDTVAEQREVKVQELLRAGRTREASAEISRGGTFPRRQRLLAALPGHSARTMISTSEAARAFRARLMAVLPVPIAHVLRSARRAVRRGFSRR